MDTETYGTTTGRNYLVRLFMVQYNLILFGGAALFSLASASPLPLLIGLGAEALFLIVGPNLPGVRRFLDRRDAAEIRAETDQAVMSGVAGLEREYAARVLALRQALEEIRQLGGRRPEPGFDHAVTRLETLLPYHLELCASHQELSTLLKATSDLELTQEIEQLKAAFAAERDLSHRLALRESLGIAQSRQEKRTNTAQQLGRVGTKIASVERTVSHLRARGSSLGQNSKLGSEVEALLAEIMPEVVELGPRLGSLAPSR